MTSNLIERPEGKGMTVIELMEHYCKPCDLYNKELTIDELDVCWKCHEYRRLGTVEK